MNARRFITAECVSKGLVILSTIAAVALDTILTSSGWPALRMWTVATFLGAFVSAKSFPAVPLSLLFGVLYLLPAAYVLMIGRFDPQFQMPWMAGLLGVVLATGTVTRWNLPRQWRWALVVWALMISVSWPVIAARETDFYLPVLDARLANSALGGQPSEVVAWVAGVAVLSMVGILWLDWLFGYFKSGDTIRFQRVVILPIALGWLIAACIGAYQTLYDITFLNHTFWANLRRAPGTMADANPFGMASALWGVLMSAAAWSAPSRLSYPLTAVLGLSWIAVWGSGSRSSLLVSVSLCAYWLYVELRRRDSIKARDVTLAVGGMICLFSVWWVVWGTGRVTGPLRRIAEFQPQLSLSWASSFFYQLWDRTSYGGLALHMIKDFPVTGVGLGSFHILVSTYSAIYEASYLQPDNAQNWYRHELAELGILGSIGWMAWCGAFLISIWKTRGARRQIPLARLVLASIMLIAGISLVGMPTQNMALALTFWVLVFWHVSLTAQTHDDSSQSGRLKPWNWAITCVIVGVFALSTGYVAAKTLRVPYRAERVGWRYRYGFYSSEQTSEGGSFAWTSDRAVDVFLPQGQWLKLTMRGAVPPDAGQRPVEVSVWRSHDRILRIIRRDSSTVTRYVRAPLSPNLMMIEILVNRTWRPSDFGGADSRRLGVAVDDWQFVNSPPADAIVID
jgi:hypothetical protein